MPHTETPHETHPCFGSEARKQERLHLPVASRTNARLRFAPAIAPGHALSPQDALAYLNGVLARGIELSMVGITGPGDPLATLDATLLTLELIRTEHPDLPLCLTTNGLNGEMAAKELAGIGLSHITVLVNAVRPEVAEKLYLWIRPGTKTVPLPEACRQLVEEQARSIAAFKREGITVKVNTAVFTGLNAGHVEEVAQRAAQLGVDIMALVGCSVDDTTEGAPCPPGPELMGMVRDHASKHLPLMANFEDCGEALVGTRFPATSAELDNPILGLPRATEDRPLAAVVSSTGMDVDLGHAHQFLIYGRREGLIQLLETRPAPKPGGGESRWLAVAETLRDCFILLTASAGDRPKEILGREGLRVVVTGENIESTVEALYGEGKKGKCKRT
ncbi:MAG: radical SAM protein [Proteobacteria bacterium]|nr:radical SAM protein [Pseudomonadota bacterium]